MHIRGGAEERWKPDQRSKSVRVALSTRGQEQKKGRTCFLRPSQRRHWTGKHAQTTDTLARTRGDEKKRRGRPLWTISSSSATSIAKRGIHLRSSCKEDALGPNLSVQAYEVSRHGRTTSVRVSKTKMSQNDTLPDWGRGKSLLLLSDSTAL